MTQCNKRPSDKILPAFRQACVQVQVETAEYLLLALEMAADRSRGQPDVDRRMSVAPAPGAHERLEDAERPNLPRVGSE